MYFLPNFFKVILVFNSLILRVANQIILSNVFIVFEEDDGQVYDSAGAYFFKIRSDIFQKAIIKKILILQMCILY